jgi:hypothetical protein
MLLEISSHGIVFLAFSIANLTYPRTSLQSSYSLKISKVNETAPSSYTRGFSLKITALQVQDNYDGSTSLWAPSADLPDAVQALIIFNFKTSVNHQLRFTVSYELYEILFLVSLLNHSTTRSFNITQNVL